MLLLYLCFYFIFYLNTELDNTYPLQQISQTGNLGSNLITRQYKLDLMARFMEIRAMNPRLTQKEIAKEIGYSTSSLQRYRHINMRSPNRIPPNSHKRKQISNLEHDLERPLMTSIDLK